MPELMMIPTPPVHILFTMVSLRAISVSPRCQQTPTILFSIFDRRVIGRRSALTQTENIRLALLIVTVAQLIRLCCGQNTITDKQNSRM